MVCLSHGFRRKGESHEQDGKRLSRERDSVRRSCHGLRSPFDSAGHRPACVFVSLAAELDCCGASPSAVNALLLYAQFSTTDAEPLDQRLVPALVQAPQIIEQLAALRHELEQAAPGMIV